MDSQKKSTLLTQQFILALKQQKFSGDIYQDASTKLVNATDNSVYQIMPQAILAPKTTQALCLIFKLANKKQFHSLSFTPRGGGTGTNGQALNDGFIIDCSKHMNEILELNLKEGWVRVQAGVVLDQLNAFLKPHNVFFAPNLSTSSRATLGGMANTDACGQGSLRYGKTSNHIIALSCVYSDGAVHTSNAIGQDQLAAIKKQGGITAEIYKQVDDSVRSCKEKINAQFPKLTRFMTGYNLAHVINEKDKQFNLNAIITGSEGTLAIVNELTLKLTPLPKHKKLLVLQYTDFSKALEHGKALLKGNPDSIETIDQTILTTAKTDVIYDEVKNFITNNDYVTGGINLVEFSSDDLDALDKAVENLLQQVNQEDQSLAITTISNPEDIAKLWELRKKSVGLLSKTKNKRRPRSGMEDTVVPPEHLAEFIGEFRALFDAKGLSYGMFGHVDAGCLHVRPALDMTDSADEDLYYELTEQVAALTKKYGGLMWGEHGKGYRSQYVPLFFGEELYKELRKIKQSFDPYNQLNPGKITTPIDSPDKVVDIKSALRGHYDKDINDTDQKAFNDSLRCDGNGACFDYDNNHVMCPSYKVTRDKRQSPNGRATLLREWLRLKKSTVTKPSLVKKIVNKFKEKHDFSHEVYNSLHGCLGCKGCVTQCPVNVNIPKMKSKFLEKYHQNYLRPLRDYAIACSEYMARWQQQFPRLISFLLNKHIIKKCFGLTDMPAIPNKSLKTLRKENAIDISTLNDIQQIKDTSNSVVIIQDWLTSTYQPQLVISYFQILKKLGFKPYLLKSLTNGKPLHAKGFMTAFNKCATKTLTTLNTISELGIAMVGVDPSIAITYRHEYRGVDNYKNAKVFLIQEWLSKQALPKLKSPSTLTPTLLMHCSEQTVNATAKQAWLTVFEKLGLKLSIATVGCCGMAGSYGHEVEHQKTSKKLYELSWKEVVNSKEILLITGISCQSQVARLSEKTTMHPIEYLVKLDFSLL
jgi:FAD/FMN-containing dehydrogenase/Fe-S oxidoreductase